MSEASTATTPIPPLEDGQRLTRAEFERRYEAMPHVKKAELLEGVVYMPSPVTHFRHGRPHFRLNTWLGVYEAATPGVEGSDNATVRLDEENEPQPDAVLLIQPECGGAVRFEDGYIADGPELVVEVSASRARIDLGPRFRVYQAHGIREYLVWRVDDGEIDWFILRGEAFVELPADASGVIRSETFPGLWLDPAGLVRLEMPSVLATLQQGLASPEHAAFVTQLAQRRQT